jgi:predicted ATPase
VAELAPISDATLAARTVAGALGVREHVGRDWRETLSEELSNRDILIVLDDCEQVVSACAELVQSLLERCPHVRVLATSREPLDVAGEVTWVVGPLSYSDPNAGSPGLVSEAVQLFLERARAVAPTFARDDAALTTIAEICWRLDGLPLAIELAAARVPLQSPVEILRSLDQPFTLLTNGRRTSPKRHQTLADAVGWSYDLLAPDERLFFERLAIFVGGCDVGAAEDVAGYGLAQRGTALEFLTRLVTKSLVVAAPGKFGATRYRMLETLPQFALTRVSEDEGSAGKPAGSVQFRDISTGSA